MHHVLLIYDQFSHWAFLEWCTVPGNPFAPPGWNSNYDIHSTIQHLTQAIQYIYKDHLRQFTPQFAISSENTYMIELSATYAH